VADTKTPGVKFRWHGQAVVSNMQQVMTSRMKTCVAFFRTKVVKSISTSSRASGASKPGQPPHANTGHLRRSIFGDVDSSRAAITGTVGTTAVYGAALEYGATIRPKKAKALTIPLTDKAGKYPAPKFPKPLTLVWPKGSKFGYLVEQSGKMSTMHYLLTRGPITLAPRPFLRRALNVHWNTGKKILQTGRP
jgi:hypothetical protein